MAWRIADNVVRGEIDNQTPGRVTGKIWLSGRDTPLVLTLSGNGHKDLAGCQLTFTNPAPKADPTISLNAEQTGVVGDMTAARKVRVIEPFDPEAIERDEPFTDDRMANALYLEWFSETNGRVVIEATDYRIDIGEPVWRLTPDEETQQHQANAAAMQSFMDRISESFDPREEAAYNGDPKDEFEWELFLRASDRRSTKLGELMEKYSDHPDRDRLVARGMGWKHIEELLDAEAEGRLDDEEDEEDLEFSDEEIVAEERDPVRHPLVARLIDRSVTLSKLAGNRRDEDLEDMVGSFMVVGPKVAGALTIGDRERPPELNTSGLVVAKLKRAVGELSRALSAADRLREAKRDLPFSLDEWVTEMLETRQEILALMDNYRKKID
jgi:hypothetical protein